MEWEILLSTKDDNVSIVKNDIEKSSDELMCDALDQAWADELYLAKWLVDIANNAYTMNNKWDIYPDNNSRIQALKEMRKIRSNKPDVQVNIQNVFWSAWSWL